MKKLTKKPKTIKKTCLQIVETGLEILQEASDISLNTGLSPEDAVCFIISWDNSFCSVTNDKAIYIAHKFEDNNPKITLVLIKQFEERMNEK